MKIFKVIVVLFIFVLCFGLIACLTNENKGNEDTSFPSKDTEASPEESTEASTNQSTTAPTQDSTEEPAEGTTEEPSDEVDFSKLSMNCLGDSVTAGGCGENNCSYVPALQECLGLNVCRKYGKGGSPIIDIGDYSFVDRYSSMADDADIILVFGGFNDHTYCTEFGDIDDTDPGTFYGALNTLVMGLQEKYPESYIFLVAPYKKYRRASGELYDETFKTEYGFSYLDFNEAIKAIGQKYDMDVLDLWDLEIDENSFIDAVHPTCDFANNVLAPTIAQFIKDNYGKAKEPVEGTTEEPSDEVDFSKLSINFLGDSITAGCGNYAPTYVPTVQEIINFLNFNNYGVGGSTIADVSDYSFIDRYSSMTNNADIILVFGGINDASSGVEMGNIDDTNSGTFYGALNTLVLGLQKKYPSSYIFLVTPYMLYSPDHYQMWDETLKLPSGYTRYDYNVAIKAIGEKYGIDVLDLWDLNTDESCFVDGVHPTVDFCSNTLAPTIAQFIKDNYKKPN